MKTSLIIAQILQMIAIPPVNIEGHAQKTDIVSAMMDGMDRIMVAEQVQLTSIVSYCVQNGIYRCFGK